jgi:hypothetical protein
VLGSPGELAQLNLLREDGKLVVVEQREQRDVAEFVRCTRHKGRVSIVECRT